jgi:hypothetical protein
MKPVVHYTWSGPVVVGKQASVWAVDHPRHVPGLLYTSLVQSIDGPAFETLNTIYRPFEVPDGETDKASKPVSNQIDEKHDHYEFLI